MVYQKKAIVYTEVITGEKMGKGKKEYIITSNCEGKPHPE